MQVRDQFPRLLYSSEIGSEAACSSSLTQLGHISSIVCENCMKDYFRRKFFESDWDVLRKIM